MVPLGRTLLECCGASMTERIRFLQICYTRTCTIGLFHQKSGISRLHGTTRNPFLSAFGREGPTPTEATAAFGSFHPPSLSRWQRKTCCLHQASHEGQ